MVAMHALRFVFLLHQPAEHVAWRACGASLSAASDGYRREQYCRARIDLASVEALLTERDALRATRQWKAADAIRTQLWDKFAVEVNDRDRRWRLDPERVPPNKVVRSGCLDLKRGPSNKATVRSGPRLRNFGTVGHDYTRADDDFSILGREALGGINDLLRERLKAKMARRFQEADRLLEVRCSR